MEWAALCGLASTLRLTRSLDLTSRYAIVSYFSLPSRSSPPSKTSHPLFFSTHSFRQTRPPRSFLKKNISVISGNKNALSMHTHANVV